MTGVIEYIILGVAALVFFAIAGVVGLAVIIRLFRRSPSVAQVLTPTPPGRVLMDAVDETGRSAASILIERKLGEYRAKQLAKDFTAAFAEDIPAAPPADPKS